jgi:hypothetical protein
MPYTSPSVASEEIGTADARTKNIWLELRTQSIASEREQGHVSRRDSGKQIYVHYA